MIPDVNYVIYGCSSARTTPKSITIPKLNTGEKCYCSYYSRQVIDDNLERQIKHQTLCTCRLYLLT